jgi:hypothetical protein
MAFSSRRATLRAVFGRYDLFFFALQFSGGSSFPDSRWQGNFGLVTPQTVEIGRLLKNLRLEKKERPPPLYVKQSLLKIKNLGGTKCECEGAPFFRYHFWLLYGFRIGSDRRLSRPVGSTQFYPRWLYREPPGIPGS